MPLPKYYLPSMESTPQAQGLETSCNRLDHWDTSGLQLAAGTK
jgi:hypothetical protein